MPFQELKPKVEAILSASKAPVELRLKEICILLKAEIPHYNWVGFYFKNGDREELKLKTFAGDPTEHTIIPFGRGICGQVAVSNQNFVVPNVQDQDNYIACSIDVKAEIVIPILKNGENIGQIDIDSHIPDPFTEEDERFLEYVNEKVAEIV